jgi:16S rRNA (guanine527-N7)-methyltransferase
MSDAIESDLDSKPVLPEHLELWQRTLDWQPSPSQQQQFQHLYKLILMGNRQFNLTRITDPEEFWEKHLWDSLTGITAWLTSADLAFQDEASLRAVDIGTGAGFPGLPVAIACPTWQITLLDSTRKKVQFLNQLITDLTLPQVNAHWGRAESVPLAWERAFDLALIRAVADASTCATYALPLLKSGGRAILYRGQWSEAETHALQPVLQRLSATLVEVRAWVTPLQSGQRHCLVLEKL